MVVVAEDVVEKILSRSLVSDLLRCKSVCKSWYSLISTTYFAKLQCKFMCNKNDDDIYTTRIAMIPSDYIYKYQSSRRPTKWGPYYAWSMGGSSHGLVCIHRYMERIIVTNPLTGEFREVAQPPGSCYNYGRVMGFGYDSSTDDYKVVMVTSGTDYITLVHILSLKSNIWKLFGQIKYDCYLDHPGILFNGALHWFMFADKEYTRPLIVSFDLVKEEFREIPQPNDSRYVYNYDYKLGLIEGSLCIYMKYNHCEIWVMKNYNGTPSWELLPIRDYHQMKKNAIHYMLKDDNQTMPPTYYCDDNTYLSMRQEHLSSPIFVQTLVSPYVNNNNDNGRPSRTNNNKSIISTGRSNHAKTNKSTVSTGRPSRTKNNESTVKVWRVKEKRETEEEVRGLVTNTYKNGSKGKERSLKSFWKKKDRVE